MNKRSFYLVEK